MSWRIDPWKENLVRISYGVYRPLTSAQYELDRLELGWKVAQALLWHEHEVVMA